jgi:phosphoglycerate dehydrogenase-like enzyme
MYTPAAGHNWAKKDPANKVPSYYGSFHGKIMAESLLSMILYFNRRIPQTIDNQHKKLWDRSIFDNTATLGSQQILIVGYGNIGREVARILKFFGSKIIAVKRDISTAKNDANIDNAITFEQIDTVLNSTDHIVFILPDDTNTDNIFTDKHFAKLKPGACLYNIGRGNCYKEVDLINALKNGNMFGAGLDVFAKEPLSQDSELWTLDNVLITPHSSAISDEYLDYYISELKRDKL